MHQCQLQLMQDSVRMVAQKLSSVHPQLEVHFWIDTLCVPSENIPEKGTAIASMETVYKQVAAVLVIDSELEIVDESSSPAYVASMIGSSIWLAHLWTIQEAVFAKEFYFQLGNNAVTEATLRQVVIQIGFGINEGNLLY
ncbi:hypothetical protein BDZ45DRAFT_676535 [Acephala macrosclerotiorum]|nr:hypothetical protein BDZ45DRAFT_676535 [Acephala macrosclerotiorum]